MITILLGLVAKLLVHIINYHLSYGVSISDITGTGVTVEEMIVISLFLITITEAKSEGTFV